MPEGDCVFDGSDVGEMSRVGDAQTAHAVGVPPFRKVALESLGAPVRLLHGRGKNKSKDVKKTM